MYKTREEMEMAHQKEVNEFPIVFAFSNEQFEQGAKEIWGMKTLGKTNLSKICGIGAGGYILKADKDRYIAEELERAGYRLFNSCSSIVKCDDKMLTHLSLSNQGIKMPTTISSPLCYRDDGNREYLNKIVEIIRLPMIVKENYGSLGRQVYFIESKEELIDLENKLIHIPHIYQQFIESSKGKDYRLIVIGGKVVAYMKRENKNSYLSNLATGGKSSVVKLPDSYIEMAEKSAKILGLDYCGVDILEGKNGEPILSEVNSNAFYEGIEKTTGVNVARLYVEYILSK